MATPVCWRFSGRIGRVSPGEQCVPAAVDIANDFAVNKAVNKVNNMSPGDGKRAYRMDMLLACTMVAAGLAIAGLLRLVIGTSRLGRRRGRTHATGF